jgi:flagellar motility protein MotE (MotC chaperone)
MMPKLRAPRLLPVTITTISVLLAVKCGFLLQAAMSDGRRADGAIVATAVAAEKEHGKSAPVRSPPLSPPPADAPRGEGAHGSAASKEAAPKNESPVIAEGPPPVSDSEKAILQELRQRRKEIDTREGTVSARESVLTAAEQKLTVRVGELQALQKQLEGLDAAQKQKEAAGWTGMVKLYEAMKPKDAATIFNELAMPVLLPLMDHMKDAKAAAVMAAMNPEKARDVTFELARMRTGHDTLSSTLGQGTLGQGPKPNALGTPLGTPLGG